MVGAGDASQGSRHIVTGHVSKWRVVDDLLIRVCRVINRKSKP